jgi:hypothetical protein
MAGHTCVALTAIASTQSLVVSLAISPAVAEVNPSGRNPGNSARSPRSFGGHEFQQLFRSSQRHQRHRQCAGRRLGNDCLVRRKPGREAMLRQSEIRDNHSNNIRHESTAYLP